jgi:hypothetical protein
VGSGFWPSLDWLLWIAEIVLVPVSLVVLVIALKRGGTRRAIWAAALALVVALTVAQPFGVEAVPMSRAEFEAGDPQRATADAVHGIDVLGIPLFGFRPYTRERFCVECDTGPGSYIRTRSWLWPMLLTNANTIAGNCGREIRPCWEPGDTRNQGDLALFNADGEWRYELSSGGNPVNPFPGTSPYLRLRIGIVSIAGLIYWALVAVGIALLIWLRGRTWSIWVNGRRG